MTHRDPRNEDGGYGAGNLVGSSESGLRSAIEARQAEEVARDESSRRENTAAGDEAGLARLADTAAPGGPRAGTPSMDDLTQGTSAASASGGARDDADRLDG